MAIPLLSFQKGFALLNVSSSDFTDHYARFLGEALTRLRLRCGLWRADIRRC